MRFMIIVRSTPKFEAELSPETADEALMAAMADYHEQLAQAGVLLDASGLQPSRTGWRIHYEGTTRTVVDGPFTETKELIAGYTLIQVRSREEALEWSRRFPNPVGEGQPAVVEVRQLYELEDFSDSQAIQRFKELGVGGA
ncbi:YciI family protein [Chitiniphilus purpureus]|uniref:YciI family protein n=1 Tax=Chitiniphilus purpureus TaxID=2981137 RepID=A0ABY6DV14_9NEIS|nr:YciI family protein [Chitiniphilus sp. CD1]UXY16911.1 YciI family protein [Chitiniphilus sp. CD1]